MTQQSRTVPEILAARANGHDCDEDGSTLLKRYVREHAPEDALSKEIAELFPVEFEEALGELAADMREDAVVCGDNLNGDRE